VANDTAMDAANKLSDENLRAKWTVTNHFGTLVHMAGAEWIWLERWNGRSPLKEEAWAQWSTESCVDLATLKERWGNVVDGRSRYVSQLDESKLANELGFKLHSGDASSMKLVHQMQHVVNHATLNRGQVVGMIRHWASIRRQQIYCSIYVEISPK
jgi:uncharacterized damage-inducible protein DinB